MERRGHIGYEAYWDERYFRDGFKGSGHGSFGAEAQGTERLIHAIVSSMGCETMLELGCGAMVFWGHGLPVDEEKYCGIDVSPKAVEMAREKFPRARIKQGDFTKPWSPSEPCYDAVVCLDVLFHIEPKHYPNLLDKIFEKAQKVVFIKTLRYVGSGYQFDHGFMEPREGWDMEYLSLTDHDKRLYCFRKQDGR